MNLIQLALTAERFTHTQPPISTEPLRCVRARDKSAACDRCIDACPTGAIRYEGGIRVETEQCIRCGLCLHTCPTGVFSGTDNVPRLLYCASQMLDHEVLEIACAQHPDPAPGDKKVDGVITTTGCLAALGASAYVGLLTRDVKQIRVRLDACADCPLALIEPTIAGTIDQANELLDSLGKPAAISVAEPISRPKRRPVYSVKNPPVSRRGFFKALGNAGHDLLPALQAQSERDRLIDGIRQLAPRNLNRPMPDDSFASFTVSDACNACTTCARICPTGALEFARNDTHFQLTFSPAACINCGLCTQFCDTDALQPAGAPTIGALISDKPVVLHMGALTRCRKCNTLFAGASDDKLCPVCTFRQQNPFGARWNPPASKSV